MAKINYTPEAYDDLDEIYFYIAFKCNVPDTAIKMVTRIQAAIKDLEYMPERYRLLDEEPWHSRKVRYFFIGNYRVIYHYVKKDDSIRILRIFYSAMDYAKRLSNSEHYFVSDHNMLEEYEKWIEENPDYFKK